MHDFGTSGVIRGDLGTFCSDLSEFRKQNHSVKLNILSNLFKHLNIQTDQLHLNGYKTFCIFHITKSYP